MKPMIGLNHRGIEEAPKSPDITERGHHLNEYFTYSLYVNICRSLFERHKLMFSLLLTIKVRFCRCGLWVSLFISEEFP